MEYRLLATPEHWAEIKPIYEAEGGRLPEPGSALILAGYEKNELVGFWGIEKITHVGPLWVAPKWRGKKIWARLNKALERLFPKNPGSGYYVFSDSDRTDHINSELGLKLMPWKVWKREF